MRSIKTISLASIKTLQPGDEIRDPILRGFGARCRNRTITYFVHTRVRNRQRWFTIGVHGSPWTPEKARERAKEILYAAEKGIDIDEVTPVDSSQTFEDVFRLYIADNAAHLKPSTLKEYSRLAAKTLVPFFKRKPFNTIGRNDIVELQKALSSKPSTSNHAVALAKIIFNWADTKDVPGPTKNPCNKIKPYRSTPRAKFLTVDDLGRLSDALRTSLAAGVATPTQISAILLMLFTGARRGEIFTLKREYVDRDRMLAHLPDSKTGAKVLHLNAHAITILDSIPEIQGNPYYLAGRFPGTCITDIKKPWEKIRKMAGLENFRLHDFRHSFASFAADTGATAHAVGALLGHGSIETTKLYVHLFNYRTRETATLTADKMHAIISGRQAAPGETKH